MSVKTYLFAAPPEAELIKGAQVFHGGDTVELEESQATVDARLVLVAEPDEPVQADTPAQPASEPDKPQTSAVTDSTSSSSSGRSASAGNTK